MSKPKRPTYKSKTNKPAPYTPMPRPRDIELAAETVRRIVEKEFKGLDKAIEAHYSGHTDCDCMTCRPWTT